MSPNHLISATDRLGDRPGFDAWMSDIAAVLEERRRQTGAGRAMNRVREQRSLSRRAMRPPRFYRAA